MSLNELITKMDEDVEEYELVLTKPEEELTDAERNYWYLRRALLETAGEYDLDEDWFKDHNEYIMKIYNYFRNDFQNSNEAETPEEQQMLVEGQKSLNILAKSIEKTGTFDIAVYRDFCLVVEHFVEKQITPERRDMLAEMLEKMNIR